MNQQKVELHVFGTPAPKGSKTAFVRNGRAVVVDGASTSGRQKLSSWVAEVSREARNERPEVPLSGPLSAEITFYMPRPKSAKNKVYCDKRPDLDKLVRATYDALTGIIFDDDSQIVSERAVKVYASPSMPPGALIHVCPIDSSVE
jgi:crossover junction endodeoxyribonuclease RusA